MTAKFVLIRVHTLETDGEASRMFFHFSSPHYALRYLIE